MKSCHSQKKTKKRSRMKTMMARVLLAGGLLLIAAGLYFANYYNLLPQRVYLAEDFNIETIYSGTDFNNNHIDDYTDIVLGARKDAQNHPAYNGAYYAGGYPPEDIGVCTDVIWRAFKEAGYSLRDMVDRDIQERPDAYPNIKKRDNNIDFRRVENLRVFFDTYAISLTIDSSQTDQWQPGDIVIFGNNTHIGIVSDKRNHKGVTYMIHNGGQPNREEDLFKRAKATAHYRFDFATLPKSMAAQWEAND